jgi:hypothetical protein
MTRTTPIPCVFGSTMLITCKSFAQRRSLRYNARTIDREVDRLMASISWLYIIPIFVFLALVAWFIGARRGGSTGNPEPVHCPSCETPMSARLIFKSPLGLSEWMCPHCRTRMDKRGRNLSQTMT